MECKLHNCTSANKGPLSAYRCSEFPFTGDSKPILLWLATLMRKYQGHNSQPDSIDICNVLN